MTNQAPSTVPDQTVTLPAGGRMPLLGFGTWQIKGAEATTAAAAALQAGYRHLDTATVYGNEAEVGRALREADVDRDDVFVTTKCPPDRADRAAQTLRESLDALGTDHVDLWLIHWSGGDDVDLALWRDFVEAQRSGLARDIGVSNFDVRQIDRLTSQTGTAPAVNQIEWSPLLFDRNVLEEHRGRGVALEGYSALRGGTLVHRVVSEVAARHGRTTAQVIVRWHLQHGVIVIPKSRNPERIRSNADVAGFELSEEDMAALDSLGRQG
jgi:diketogulonate reductase-like aldo/keto reductase